MEREQMIKFVIVGDSGVGKSNILSRYVSNEFGKCESTMGCQSVMKKVQINGRKLRLMIWDTAGQQKYKSITSVYYKNAVAIILVYDITTPQSFENLTRCYTVQFSPSSTIKILVANKTDLEANRKIDRSQGQLFARERNIGFEQVSAANGSNINKIFQDLVKEYIQKPSTQSNQFKIKNIVLSSKSKSKIKEKSSCC